MGSVFGNVRTAPLPHLAATGVRLVQSADEVSYHMIEAAHAALKLQKVRAEPAIATTPASKHRAEEPVSPQKEIQPIVAVSTAPTASTSAPSPEKAALEGSQLRDAIVAYVQREG